MHRGCARQHRRTDHVVASTDDEDSAEEALVAVGRAFGDRGRFGDAFDGHELIVVRYQLITDSC